MKKGHWILLDEINLAAAETLECLSGLLEGSAGSLVLLDRGDTGKAGGFSGFSFHLISTIFSKDEHQIPKLKKYFAKPFISKTQISINLMSSFVHIF